MIGTLVSYLISGKGMQTPEIRNIREASAQNGMEEDAAADATTIGLASSWG